MTPQKRSALPHASGPHRSEQFKDEVYRQMFRLEASRPGAELDLALALLRAWMAANSASDSNDDRQWLKKICPICLVMIESALKPAHGSNPSLL